MEFFCVRSKSRCYYLKKKVKSEPRSRPSSRLGSNDQKRCKGFNQTGINQTLIMATPPNAGCHDYYAWDGITPSDPQSHIFPPSVHQNSPLSSRQPSYAYPIFPNPNVEGRNWNIAGFPDMRSPTFDAGGANEEYLPRQKPRKQTAKKGGAKTQRRSSGTPIASYASQSGTAQEVYVYPWSTPHISFPIVDHSRESRARHSSPWPTCYMAVAPNCATCHDVEEALAPRASGLVVIARTSPKGEGRPIQSFTDIMALRNETFQLEIWDEDDGASGSSKGATK